MIAQCLKKNIFGLAVFSSGRTKEYEILRSPGSGASLLKTGQLDNYCAMRGICLLNRAISPTFLPLYWT
jgi:hypothetical protein